MVELEHYLCLKSMPTSLMILKQILPQYNDTEYILKTGYIFKLLTKLNIISEIYKSKNEIYYLMPALLSNTKDPWHRILAMRHLKVFLRCASVLKAVPPVDCSVHLWPIYCIQRIANYA